MSPVLFWTFAVIMLGFALLLIIHRNPVASALSLVVSFLGLAALFVSLDAYFIGVIQILVYAGAVMVLFLFIIMLLDLRAESRRQLNLPALFGGIVVIALFIKILYNVSFSFGSGRAYFPPVDLSQHADAWNIGMTLFQHYNIPFQVVGALVMVASVGVVVLSKRELK
jgi:NADH-quinone oxidoreductase subunit J